MTDKEILGYATSSHFNLLISFHISSSFAYLAASNPTSAMKFTKAILAIVLTAILIWALETKFGDIPAIGVFLNPSTGFWQNAESKNIAPSEKLKLSGLLDEVVIKYDDHRIPHI